PIPLGLQEGDLMPDTYFIHRGDTRESVVMRMKKSMQEFMDAQWASRQANLPLKNKQEAMVLASMIEKETGVDGERGRVASVFVNRLRKGMLLQSDPTVVYGIELKDGPMGRPLWLKDLKVDHPYNTYVHAGLPPKPIANPGKEAIKAALNPPQTNDFYFVATGSGGHFFAKTLAEHNRNVAKYRAVLKSQKAKP
ncbi:MAG: endolytic transglycosylase MltG, partial [Rickettsiales bacterium]|nr:endolytic transglycosylase MltG [Rickettsiales bacterium]